MIRIIIGTEPDQYLTQRVLEYSIRKNTKRLVDIRFVYQNENRVGGTNFGFVRFHVPQLCGYSGRAIYMDADQLVLGDVGELFESLDEVHSVALVNDPVGYFGGKVVAKHNQTSVMVLNCERLKHWEPRMFDPVVPNRNELKAGQIHYRDFMTLSWMDQSEILPLNPAWNHFNVVQPDSKLVHFSHVRSQPWKNPSHPLTDFWEKWLREAIRAGYVKRKDVIREVLRGHVHKYCLRWLLPMAGGITHAYGRPVVGKNPVYQ